MWQRTAKNAEQRKIEIEQQGIKQNRFIRGHFLVHLEENWPSLFF